MKIGATRFGGLIYFSYLRTINKKNYDKDVCNADLP